MSFSALTRPRLQARTAVEENFGGAKFLALGGGRKIFGIIPVFMVAIFSFRFSVSVFMVAIFQRFSWWSRGDP